MYASSESFGKTACMLRTVRAFADVISTKMSYIGSLCLGLPCLQNLVNVYTSSNNRNDFVYTELTDLIFFIMQISKIADFFP